MMYYKKWVAVMGIIAILFLLVLFVYIGVSPDVSLIERMGLLILWLIFFVLMLPVMSKKICDRGNTLLIKIDLARKNKEEKS